MKSALFKQKMRVYSLHNGFLAFAVCLLLVSASLVQAADTRIAFMSNRHDERNGEIYLMNSDGKRVRRLTNHPQYDSVPAWSPDGKKITYMSFRGEPKPRGEIYVMNPDGTNPINLTQSPEIREGASSWSPDGKQIAYESFGIFNANGFFQSDIWVMDVDGTNPRNLTNHVASDWNPDWSPDGTQIVFQSDRNSDWEFDIWGGNWEVYVMTPDGANLVNLTKHPAKDGSPAWSPDGKQIAFSTNRDGNREVYVMTSDGANLINLTKHPARDGGPAWSPDGLKIAFSTNRDGDWEKKPNDNWEVYVMNADGTNPINLTNHPAWDSAPAWEPAPALSVSRKGRLATLWGNVKRNNAYGAK